MRRGSRMVVTSTFGGESHHRHRRRYHHHHHHHHQPRWRCLSPLQVGPPPPPCDASTSPSARHPHPHQPSAHQCSMARIIRHTLYQTTHQTCQSRWGRRREAGEGGGGGHGRRGGGGRMVEVTRVDGLPPRPKLKPGPDPDPDYDPDYDPDHDHDPDSPSVLFLSSQALGTVVAPVAIATTAKSVAVIGAAATASAANTATSAANTATSAANTTAATCVQRVDSGPHQTQHVDGAIRRGGGGGVVRTDVGRGGRGRRLSRRAVLILAPRPLFGRWRGGRRGWPSGERSGRVGSAALRARARGIRNKRGGGRR